MNFSLPSYLRVTFQLCLLVLLQACVAESSKKVSVAAISDLSIITQPVSQAVVFASDVSFSVVASGATNISYQWYKSNTPIPGETDSTFSISSVGFEDTGLYYVVVKDSITSVKSARVNLTVSASSIAPTIRTQPATITVTEGFNASFSVVATGTNLTYQWFKGSVPVDDATSSVLLIEDVETTDAGIYHVIVSNDASSVRSFSARLFVDAIVIAPVITEEPASISVAEDDPFELTVVATGTNLTYQWYLDGFPISGATTATYSVSNSLVSDEGFYQVMVSNSAGSEVSVGAFVTVNALLTAPVISVQPVSMTVVVGSEAEFTVSASGVGNTYQWFKDDTAIDEATSSTLSFASANLADAGVYKVEIENSLGETESDEVNLTISPATNGTNTVNVVTAAQSFKNVLNIDQQATLQMEYSLTNATTWSANSTIASPRNGLLFSQIDTSQLEKALDVTEAALSAEGSVLLTEIFAADAELKNYDSVHWSEDKYSLAYLGSPSVSDPWLLQLSGHNLGLNIVYNGPFFSGTPLLLATQPTNWVDNNFVSHAPMENQRAAMKNLVDKISTKTNVVIGGTFTDVLMGANGSAGYDTNYPQTYPTTNRGALAATFSDVEKEALKLAIQAWVNLLASDVAADVLAAYEADAALDATYVAINKSTVDFSSNPSGLSSQNSYIRIDGPRVWIEFLVTAGTIVTNKVQYRSVWRDKSADYGAGF
jgi:hypothetical protein